jgi:nicotinate-nucleotide adenylyltransferase
LGGSFNPVHLGHLFLADAALVELKLDRVVMIPAYRSPFKLEPTDSGSTVYTESTANDRLEMLAAAIAGDPRLTIDDCELKREGVSYTVDTLDDIISRYMPSGKPVLIIGDDLADEFLKWRNSEKILQIADIAIGHRINSCTVDYPFPHTIIRNEVMNISSRMVRKKIKEGTNWRSLVPAGIIPTIEDRQLYGITAASNNRTDKWSRIIMQIEAAVREAINPARFLHSRNTALLAYDLCRRFGLDPMAGYLAGIAHDLAKQLDAKLLIKLAKSDGKPINGLEKEKPGLLHGRAAAVLLKERFSIYNNDVLEAVAVHTSGSEHMGPLAKVVYIADKAEVSRNITPEYRRMCLLPTEGQVTEELIIDDLDFLFFAILKKTVSKLQSKELDLSEETLRLLDKMKERNNMKNNKEKNH